MDHYWAWRAQVAERELRLIAEAWEHDDTDGTYCVYGGSSDIFTAQIWGKPAWGNGYILALGNPPQFTQSNRFVNEPQDRIQKKVDRLLDDIMRLKTYKAVEYSSDGVITVLLVGTPEAAEIVAPVPYCDYEWFADALKGDDDLEFLVSSDKDPVQVWYGNLRIGLIMPMNAYFEHERWLRNLGITMKA